MTLKVQWDPPDQGVTRGTFGRFTCEVWRESQTRWSAQVFELGPARQNLRAQVFGSKSKEVAQRQCAGFVGADE